MSISNISTLYLGLNSKSLDSKCSNNQLVVISKVKNSDTSIESGNVSGGSSDKRSLSTNDYEYMNTWESEKKVLKRLKCDSGVSETSLESINLMISDISSMTTPEPLNAPESQFKFIKRLGRGGCGEVNLVEHQHLIYAMKTGIGACGKEELVREHQILAALPPHPSLMQSHGLFTVDTQHYLLMEYIEGKTLTQLFSQIKKAYECAIISHCEFWGVTQHIIKKIIKALLILENAGYSHCDIKSDNVLLDTSTNKIKIIDFGRTSLIGKDILKCGTLITASPESIYNNTTKSNLVTDCKQDSYAVGKMLFELHEGEQSCMGLREQFPILFFATNLVIQLHKAKESGNKSPKERKASAELTCDNLILKPIDKIEKGSLIKSPGKYGCRTAYVNFVNNATLLDPESRFGLSQLLNHEFISDPLLTKQEARKVMTRLLDSSKSSAFN